MSFALSGIASGLDSASLVNQLIALEAQPQRLLQNQSATFSKQVTAFQGLNTRVASIADAAKALVKGDAINSATGSSSDESITVKAGTTATPANLAVKVERLASGQTSAISEAQLAALPMPPQLTISVGDALHTIHPATGSMQDVAKAINDAEELGLSAVMVKVGAGETYALQVTSKSGAENAFTITDQNGTELASAATATVKAQDAQLTLTSLGQTLTSATNTFEGIMPGVDVTVSKVTDADAQPATISVARDEDAAAKAAKALVDTTNVVLNEIASQTKSSTKVTDGRSVVTPGTLSGDSLVRSLGSAVSSALSYGVDGKSPSEYGISIQRDGTFTFDQEKFTEVLKADPAGTNDFLTKLAERVQTAAESYSDKHDGLLTTKIKTHESQIKNLDNQVAAWDVRLDNKRTTLERTYSALEVAMQNMQSQQQWLAGQLASLPSGSMF